jgi:hypothetical protein
MAAQIYDQFSSQITNLQEQATNVSDANLEDVQREWRVPDGWVSGPTDIFGMGPPFTREEMNDDYQSILTSDSGAGDAMACKIQADHLACQERAFRLQFATGIRCLTHAASRRAGHGSASDGCFARITDHLVDLIVAGAQ